MWKIFTQRIFAYVLSLFIEIPRHGVNEKAVLENC